LPIASRENGKMKSGRLLLLIANAVITASTFLMAPIALADEAPWQKRMQDAQRAYEALDWPGKEKTARAALQSALAKGVTGRDLAQLYEDLADALFNQYKHTPEVLQDYKSALAIREQCLPADSVDIAKSLYGVGFCLGQGDNPDEGVPFLNRSLQIFEKVFGTDSMETYAPIAMLMIIDFRHQDMKAGRAKQERLLAISTKRKGATKEELYIQNELTGAIREGAGDPQAAKLAYMQAKQIRDTLPPGYFAPDNLDQHLNMADRQLYRPQDISYKPITPQHQPYVPPVSTAPQNPPQTPFAPNVALNVSPPKVDPTNQTPPSDTIPNTYTPPRIIASLPVPPPAEQGRYEYSVEGKTVSYNTYKSRVLFNEAGQYVKNKEYDQAKAKLEESLQLDNKFPDALCALGTVMAHLGCKDDALECIKDSIALDPQLHAAYIALAGLYEAMGKLSEALDAYRQFLRRFPDNPNYAIVLSTTRLAEKEFTARNAPTRCPNVDGADGIHDYLTAAARDGLICWAKGSFPLRVYIKRPPGIVGGVDPNKLLHQCLSEWTERTDGLIGFKETNSKENANIVIGWVTADGELAEDAEAGEARVKLLNNAIYSAEVAIDLRKPEQGMFAGKLHTTILHELGHCLGLHGHSPNPDDVMYFTELMTGPIAGLSSRDVKTVQLLYASTLSARP